MSIWDRLRRMGGLNEEIDAELRFHLEEKERRLIADGLTPAQARREARKAFGSQAAVREHTRDIWIFRWADDLWRDLRYAARGLRRSPGFTAVAVLTLALGIASVLTIYAVINSVLLRPLPYRSPDRLVWITVYHEDSGAESVRPSVAAAFEQARAIESIASFSTKEDPESGLNIVTTSAPLSESFGVVPAAGHDFLSRRIGDDQQTIILSDDFFRRKFGGDLSILGASMRLGDRLYVVVGVLPRDFRLPLNTQLSAQLEADAITIDYAPRSAPGLVARLRSGYSPAAARSELAGILANEDEGEIRVQSLHSSIVGPMRQMLLILSIGVACIVLIVCVNVVNLLIVRASSRIQHSAIRIALGARPSALLRLSLAETFVLALAGGGLGLLLAVAGLDYIVLNAPPDIPLLRDAAIDFSNVALAIFSSLLLGAVCGVAPALLSMRSVKSGTPTPANSSRNRAHWRSSLDQAFVVLQLSSVLVLMSGSALIISSYWHMNSALVEPDQVLVTRLLVSADLRRNAVERDRLLDRLEALPGVSAAASDGGTVLAMAQNWHLIGVEPAPRQPRSIREIFTTAHYFETLGLQLVAGRYIGSTPSVDVKDETVVNEAFLRTYAPSIADPTDALGRQLAHVNEGTTRVAGTIVGIVQDARLGHNASVKPQIFQSALGAPVDVFGSELLIRTTGSTAIHSLVFRAIEAIPGVTILRSETLADRLSAALAPRRFQSRLLTGLAVVGLLLSMMGVYGVVSFVVTTRTRELALRLVLGARRTDVLRLILGRGLRLAIAGTLLGIVGSIAVLKLLAAALVGVSPSLYWVYGCVSALLISAVLLASYFPARRAATINPSDAIRQE